MSTPQPSSETAVPEAPAPQSAPGSAAAGYWPGWPEIRSDLRSAALLMSALALVGLPTGVLWWALAPRLDFRITAAGPVPVVAAPSSELLIADDAVFALILLGLGLLCGAAAWRLRRRRGVAILFALAVGTSILGTLAWQVGEYLGAGPTRAELTHVGARVTTSLTLGSLPALALAPFGALLAYLVAVLYVRGDDLGRTGPRAGIDAGAAGPGDPRGQEPAVSATTY